MRLPSFKPKELLKILQKSGFYIDHQSGSHIALINDTTKKRVTLPFHNRDLKKGTLHSIVKQSGLSTEEIIKLS